MKTKFNKKITGAVLSVLLLSLVLAPMTNAAQSEEEQILIEETEQQGCPCELTAEDEEMTGEAVAVIFPIIIISGKIMIDAIHCVHALTDVAEHIKPISKEICMRQCIMKYGDGSDPDELLDCFSRCEEWF